MKAVAVLALLGVCSCAAVTVPVKVAGTTVGAGAKVAGAGVSAAGDAVLLVTRDGSVLR